MKFERDFEGKQIAVGDLAQGLTEWAVEDSRGMGREIRASLPWIINRGNGVDPEFVTLGAAAYEEVRRGREAAALVGDLTQAAQSMAPADLGGDQDLSRVIRILDSSRGLVRLTSLASEESAMGALARVLEAAISGFDGLGISRVETNVVIHDLQLRLDKKFRGARVNGS